MKFRTRHEAGRLLAVRLRQCSWDWPLVVALPRGGLAVGAEVARALDAPLFPLVTRKLGRSGAVAEGGALVVDREEPGLASLIEKERLEVQRRVRLYRRDQPLPPLWGRSVIIVDDGLETGASMRAAARALREAEAAEVVAAAPVVTAGALEAVRREVNDVIALQTPPTLEAIADFYNEFHPLTDNDMLRILEVAREQPVRPPSHERDVSIPLEPEPVEATLCVPEPASALVIFAPGLAGSRRSLRARQIAAAIRAEGFATLLLDLVTHDRGPDLTHLARRLAAAVAWTGRQPELGALPVGIAGTGIGGAAMLLVAAARPQRLAALVSRGRRLPLDDSVLERIEAPTLLVVGEHDPASLQVNRRAFRSLRCQRELVVIPGAGHLFEEQGALEQVSALTNGWFLRHLTPALPAETLW